MRRGVPRVRMKRLARILRGPTIWWFTLNEYLDALQASSVNAGPHQPECSTMP